MNEVTQKAIHGALTAQPTSQDATPTLVYLTNDFDIPIRMCGVSASGRLHGFWKIDAGATEGFSLYNFPAPQVILNFLSGSFMTVVEFVSGTTEYSVGVADLTAPNDIGEVPTPNQETIVPQNTPRITVGVGVLPNGNFVVREQYWKKMPNSFSLAAGEQDTVSITTTSGIERTSSTQEEVSTSLGFSASAGWGPVSSSLSASLSATASAFQQVTVREQTQTYRSKVLSNTSGSSEMYLVWQLTDVTTVFNPTSYQALASLVSGEEPTIISGPFDPDELPPPPTRNAEPAGYKPIEPVDGGDDA